LTARFVPHRSSKEFDQSARKFRAARCMRHSRLEKPQAARALFIPAIDLLRRVLAEGEEKNGHPYGHVEQHEPQD
jgi:hypothetical protein